MIATTDVLFRCKLDGLHAAYATMMQNRSHETSAQSSELSFLVDGMRTLPYELCAIIFTLLELGAIETKGARPKRGSVSESNGKRQRHPRCLIPIHLATRSTVVRPVFSWNACKDGPVVSFLNAYLAGQRSRAGLDSCEDFRLDLAAHADFRSVANIQELARTPAYARRVLNVRIGCESSKNILGLLYAIAPVLRYARHLDIVSRVDDALECMCNRGDVDVWTLLGHPNDKEYPVVDASVLGSVRWLRVGGSMLQDMGLLATATRIQHLTLDMEKSGSSVVIHEARAILLGMTALRCLRICRKSAVPDVVEWTEERPAYVRLELSCDSVDKGMALDLLRCFGHVGLEELDAGVQHHFSRLGSFVSGVASVSPTLQTLSVHVRFSLTVLLITPCIDVVSSFPVVVQLDGRYLRCDARRMGSDGEFCRVGRG